MPPESCVHSWRPISDDRQRGRSSFIDAVKRILDDLFPKVAWVDFPVYQGRKRNRKVQEQCGLETLNSLITIESIDEPFLASHQTGILILPWTRRLRAWALGTAVWRSIAPMTSRPESLWA